MDLTGPSTQIVLTNQFIPNNPFSTTNSIYLSYFTASTQSGTYGVLGTQCTPLQIYDYDILDCGGVSLTAGIGLLSSGGNCATFSQNQYAMKVCPNDSYIVVITGSSEEEPNAPCYVDAWINDNVNTTTDIGITVPLLYKLSWSASQGWIFNQWVLNGNKFTGGSLYPNGIPILNTINHTPQ